MQTPVHAPTVVEEVTYFYDFIISSLLAFIHIIICVVKW